MKGGICSLFSRMTMRLEFALSYEMLPSSPSVCDDFLRHSVL